MALETKRSDRDPCKFVGKLLVLPGRWEDTPALFTGIYWDDDGGGFDGFFLVGEEIRRHYFSMRTFFAYCWLAEEFY